MNVDVEGGAVYVAQDANFQCTRCEFDGNSASGEQNYYYGGAISTAGICSVVPFNNSISQNF